MARTCRGRVRNDRCARSNTYVLLRPKTFPKRVGGRSKPARMPGNMANKRHPPNRVEHNSAHTHVPAQSHPDNSHKTQACTVRHCMAGNAMGLPRESLSVAALVLECDGLHTLRLLHGFELVTCQVVLDSKCLAMHLPTLFPPQAPARPARQPPQTLPPRSGQRSGDRCARC